MLSSYFDQRDGNLNFGLGTHACVCVPKPRGQDRLLSFPALTCQLNNHYYTEKCIIIGITVDRSPDTFILSHRTIIIITLSDVTSTHAFCILHCWVATPAWSRCSYISTKLLLSSLMIWMYSHCHTCQQLSCCYFPYFLAFKHSI